jgi:hypothetical protein
MKKIILLGITFISMGTLMAQLTVKAKCDAFVVDILDGKVNTLKASATTNDIKTKLPCFTSVEEDGGTSKCGGAVYFKDKDISFFTQRDYILIGEKFKGQLSIPLMGGKRDTFFKYLGNPKMKDDNWDAFITNYGIIILYYNAASKVNKIVMSTKNTSDISICE